MDKVPRYYGYEDILFRYPTRLYFPITNRLTNLIENAHYAINIAIVTI